MPEADRSVIIRLTIVLLLVFGSSTNTAFADGFGPKWDRKLASLFAHVIYFRDNCDLDTDRLSPEHKKQNARMYDLMEASIEIRGPVFRDTISATEIHSPSKECFDISMANIHSIFVFWAMGADDFAEPDLKSTVPSE